MHQGIKGVDREAVARQGDLIRRRPGGKGHLGSELETWGLLHMKDGLKDGLSMRALGPVSRGNNR